MLDTNIVVRKTENKTTVNNIVEEASSAEMKRSHEVSKFMRFDSGSLFEATVFATSCHPFVFRKTAENNHHEKSSPRDWYSWENIYRTPIRVLQATVFGKDKFLVEYVEVGPESEERHFSSGQLLNYTPKTLNNG